jgi:hypothetical protein
VLQNLIPILMERPDRVYLVISAVMARRGAERSLERQLKASSVESVRCTDCPDSGFVAIQTFADQVAETVMNDCADAEIVLNATGGNKLMSFGFVEAFRGIASQMLYTDTANRRIEFLPAAASGEDAPPPDPTPMTDVLDVPAYLRAQGFQYRHSVSDDPDWWGMAQKRKAACKFLGKRIANPHVQYFVGLMNKLAGQALEQLPGSHEERLAAPVQSFSRPPLGLWKEAMMALNDAGAVSWDPDSAAPEYFRFADAASARFIRGGWLEEYAFHVLNDEGAYDIRLGVEGVWDSDQTMRNEFDVLACNMNQLLFVECKTLHYQEGQNDNEIAYKLDSLGEDARGLFGSTWLLSAREPTDTLSARARRARIRLVPPSEIQNLRQLVRTWRA